ncbi:carotenoid 1,2-hydratase [Ideonella sp. DXS29W]|uniref:Carotenoid 1,2-hydratase n=1 Tax=Ideonella lacteola TaxID=2984193 RepID=A0ABU9BMS2_9BURK
MPLGGPGFDTPLNPGGYVWWYLDATSDDGRHGLTLIAFIGSVFSPYYARARRRGPADPADHVALNCALYGTGPNRWTMTERGRGALQRNATRLQIGPSALQWDRGVLEVTLDELAVPWPGRVRGRLRVEPSTVIEGGPFTLDAAGAHRWQPIAPRARVSLHLDAPALHWSGEGYLDTNWGDTPLEESFSRWHWSRCALPDGNSQVRYDVHRLDGSTMSLNMKVGRDGQLNHEPPGPTLALPRTRWRLARETRGEARLLQTWEDGPFYARSLLSVQHRGQAMRAVHESLSLDRFAAPWVQALLPFRMPRRAG